MAVGAHELAFCQPRHRDCTRATGHHLADVPDFLRAREMVPMHDPHRKYLTAISARHTLLQRRHPRTRLHQAQTSTGKSRRPSTLLVVATVVCAPTFTAIGELTRARIVKLASRFPHPAHRAPPECHRVREGGVVLASLIHRRPTNYPSRLARMSESRGNSRIPTGTSRSPRGSPRADGLGSPC